MSTQKFLFICSFIGRNYKGVQRQTSLEDSVAYWNSIKSKAGRKLKPLDYTVQDAIERVFYNICKVPTSIHLASRLDVGVNAYCLPFQVVIGRTEDQEMFEPFVLKRAFNGHLRSLGEEISIIDVRKVSKDFNCRSMAVKKEYIYRVESNANQWIDYIQQQKKCCWTIGERLDVEKVQEGAKIFVGTHDFTHLTTVRKIETKDRSTIRKIEDITFSPYKSEFPTEGIQKFELKFTAKSFLVYQVRFMVGALVGLGQGKIDIDLLRRLLENPHEYQLGALSKYHVGKAPGEGLFLANVDYDASSLQ